MTLQPFGPWRPDMASTNPGISRQMRNVILRRDTSGISVEPMPSLGPIGVALPSAPLSTGSAVTRAGVYVSFAGTATNLYRSSSSFTYSSVGSGFAVPPGDVWSFEQFGDFMVASNTVDGQVQYNVETSTGFAAVGGTPPKARVLARIFQCMFALDCDGDNRLARNSDIENHEEWRPGVGVAGYQTFVDGEELLGGAEWSSGSGCIIQRNAVRLLTRVPNEQLYQQDILSFGVGATNPQGIVHIQGASFFPNNDGFYMASSAGVVPIGADKVNQWFLERASGNALNTIEGAYDPINRRVIWRYQAADVMSEEVFQNEMIYDLRLEEFVEGEFPLSGITTVSSPGYTLEELDVFGPLDTLPYSLDDRAWFGGEPRLGGFDGSFKFGFFDGDNLEAVAETAITDFNESMMVNSVRPVTDAQAAVIRVGQSDNLYTPLVYSDPAAIQPEGHAPIYARGKNLTFEMTVPAAATWSEARGADDIELEAEGGW